MDIAGHVQRANPAGACWVAADGCPACSTIAGMGVTPTVRTQGIAVVGAFSLKAVSPGIQLIIRAARRVFLFGFCG